MICKTGFSLLNCIYDSKMFEVMYLVALWMEKNQWDWRIS